MDEYIIQPGLFSIGEQTYRYFPLAQLHQINPNIHLLPYSIRILLESLLRLSAKKAISIDTIRNLANWQPNDERKVIPFYPSRVVMQDFSGVPVLVDLAAMRSAAQKVGKDPDKINPVIPVDLVIDHSIQVDYYNRSDALDRNSHLEFERNEERYRFLHWAQSSFSNLRIVPPSSGIVHQVNLEYLSQVVMQLDGFVHPETVVGTDSHTTMINGLGVVGWGVGGIEAIAAMLGQPLEIVTPDVIGFYLTGQLQPGVTPTDLTLTITKMLRAHGVVNKFVEFYGPGVQHLSLADRAMIANMSPENGATITYFPVDTTTLEYLNLTGRDPQQVKLVETYFKIQGLFNYPDSSTPNYSAILHLDVSTVEPSLAGPKRPQDQILLTRVKYEFARSLLASKTERGYGLAKSDLDKQVELDFQSGKEQLQHGSVVIAAITSCTNTSNPTVMIGAGLLAKKAVEAGLRRKPFVKTSLAPGSKVVVNYLQKAGLLDPLEQLGFSVVGFGCTTCIGNSGPLDKTIADAITQNKLITVAVLSGNRNFEGRVHPLAQANFLASPLLVVAYAIAGTVSIDLTTEPLGIGKDGKVIYLSDIWPSSDEIQELAKSYLTAEIFSENYSSIFTANEQWRQIDTIPSKIFKWDRTSTYIQEPPYFRNTTHKSQSPQKYIRGARVLAMFGDSVTTDHISPAGDIPVNSPAGSFLTEKGVLPVDFNSYGSRRGNDQVLTRGTFANIRIKNQLTPGVEGGYTIHFPTQRKMTIYDAARLYQQENIPLIVLAGKEYGTGSSRDWAAKGPLLLGVKAIIAESYERIHRSNLAGMGVLPLQFEPGQNAPLLGLTGAETFDIEDFGVGDLPGSRLEVIATLEDGTKVLFNAIARLDTPLEVSYYLKGGLLTAVIEELLQD